MVLTSFLVVVFAGLVSADFPCRRLHDVTTLRGSMLEVHSRTNAVGIPTNVSSLRTEVGYSIDATSAINCFRSIYETCSEWRYSGFESSFWDMYDTYTNGWSSSVRNRSEHSLEINHADGSRSLNFDLDEYSFYKTFVFAVHLRADTLFTRPFYIGASFGNSSKSGLRFVVSNYSSHQWTISYQEHTFSVEHSLGNKPRYIEKRGGIHGNVTVTLKDQPYLKVFLRIDGEQFCMWIEIANHSMDCLYKANISSGFLYVFTDRLTDFQVRHKYKKAAMKLSRTNGWASITPFTVQTSGYFCISLRYILKKGDSTTVQFLAHDFHRRILLHSGMLQDSGQIVSQQFSMLVPETYRSGELNVTFFTESAGSLLLRSFRECSSEDTDVVLIERSRVECPTLPCNDSDRRKNNDNMGLTSICYNPLDPLQGGSHKRCNNGGEVVNGWCACLPGFTGSTCERPCPPGRFGMDCGGVCVDDHECKGVSMAAPGLPFECARGFTGPGCNETCKHGFYGPNCRLKCGECLFGTCDRFTGFCNGLCKQGYTDRACQQRQVVSYNVTTLTTNVTSAEIQVYVSVIGLENNGYESYPFIQLQYKKLEEPDSRWTSIHLPFSLGATKFTLRHLDYHSQYVAKAALIHESGSIYQGTSSDHYKAVFYTDCVVGQFDDVVVLAEENQLRVNWSMSQSKIYPCYLIGYTLEVYLPGMIMPIKGHADPHSNHIIVNRAIPSSGTLRLGANFLTKGLQWSYHLFSIIKNNNE